MKENLYIECDCSSKDHVVCLSIHQYEWKDGYIDISFYIETQMSIWAGFFKRVIAAFKYVFRPENACKFGYWSCCQVSVEEAKKIRELLDDYIDLAETTRVDKN